jgi:hypothetical protein
VLKRDLQGVEARIMERVEGRIDAVEDRMKDFIRHADQDLETKIIAEFWKWGRTSDMRTKQALDTASAVSERLLAVEDRVTALERKSSPDNVLKVDRPPALHTGSRHAAR